jgi:hypothetical protein
MQLLDYLDLKKQNVSQFADEVGLTVSRVWRHANGKTRPDAQAIRLYEEHTKGAVTANDWVDLELGLADPPEEDDSGEPVVATG